MRPFVVVAWLVAVLAVHVLAVPTGSSAWQGFVRDYLQKISTGVDHVGEQGTSSATQLDAGKQVIHEPANDEELLQNYLERLGNPRGNKKKKDKKDLTSAFEDLQKNMQYGDSEAMQRIVRNARSILLSKHEEYQDALRAFKAADAYLNGEVWKMPPFLITAFKLARIARWDEAFEPKLTKYSPVHEAAVRATKLNPGDDLFRQYSELIPIRQAAANFGLDPGYHIAEGSPIEKLVTRFKQQYRGVLWSNQVSLNDDQERILSMVMPKFVQAAANTGAARVGVSKGLGSYAEGILRRLDFTQGELDELRQLSERPNIGDFNLARGTRAQGGEANPTASQPGSVERTAETLEYWANKPLGDHWTRRTNPAHDAAFQPEAEPLQGANAPIELQHSPVATLSIPQSPAASTQLRGPEVPPTYGAAVPPIDPEQIRHAADMAVQRAVSSQRRPRSTKRTSASAAGTSSEAYSQGGGSIEMRDVPMAQPQPIRDASERRSRGRRTGSTRSAGRRGSAASMADSAQRSGEAVAMSGSFATGAESSSSRMHQPTMGHDASDPFSLDGAETGAATSAPRRTTRSAVHPTTYVYPTPFPPVYPTTHAYPPQYPGYASYPAYTQPAQHVQHFPYPEPLPYTYGQPAVSYPSHFPGPDHVRPLEGTQHDYYGSGSAFNHGAAAHPTEHGGFSYGEDPNIPPGFENDYRRE